MKEHKSPINDQPLPRGKQFTSETAREARQKRTIKEAQQKSVTDEVRKMMSQEFTDKNGNGKSGAEVIAQTIVKESMKGNPRMIELLIGLIGEKPVDRVQISEVDAKTIEEVEKMVKG